MDVKVFKALADEKRLEILEQIISDECCVDKACACEMIKTLDITQPTLSHHVKILSDAKLINVQKEGKYSYFTINEEKMKEVISFLGRFKNEN